MCAFFMSTSCDQDPCRRGMMKKSITEYKKAISKTICKRDNIHGTDPGFKEK